MEKPKHKEELLSYLEQFKEQADDDKLDLVEIKQSYSLDGVFTTLTVRDLDQTPDFEGSES